MVKNKDETPKSDVDSVLQEYIKKPEIFFQSSDVLANDVKSNLKKLFDYSTDRSSKFLNSLNASSLPLDELVVDNLDAEDIWGEISIQQDSLFSSLSSFMSKMTAEEKKSDSKKTELKLKSRTEDDLCSEGESEDLPDSDDNSLDEDEEEDIEDGDEEEFEEVDDDDEDLGQDFQSDDNDNESLGSVDSEDDMKKFLDEGDRHMEKVLAFKRGEKVEESDEDEVDDEELDLFSSEFEVSDVGSKKSRLKALLSKKWTAEEVFGPRPKSLKKDVDSDESGSDDADSVEEDSDDARDKALLDSIETDEEADEDIDGGFGYDDDLNRNVKKKKNPYSDDEDEDEDEDGLEMDEDEMEDDLKRLRSGKRGLDDDEDEDSFVKSKKSKKLKSTNEDEDMLDDDALGEPDYEEDYEEEEDEAEESSPKQSLLSDEEDAAATSSILTRYEREKEKLAARIREIEAHAVGEKEWLLRGEIGSKLRPENSLLSAEMEYQQAVKAAPVVTVETTTSLEDMIKQRVLDAAFDNPIRRDHAAIGSGKKYDENGEKTQPELSTEKAQQGLADIYADAYLAQVTGFSKVDEKHKRLEQECENLAQLLFGKLDALCNVFFVPRAAADDLTVTPSVGSIALEEALPVAVSTATTKAPEEIFSAAAKSSKKLQSRGEMSQEERQVARRALKRANKLEKRLQERENRLKLAQKVKANGGTFINGKADSHHVRKEDIKSGKVGGVKISNVQEDLKGATRMGSGVRDSDGVSDFNNSTALFEKLQKEAEGIRNSAKAISNSNKELDGLFKSTKHKAAPKPLANKFKL